MADARYSRLAAWLRWAIAACVFVVALLLFRSNSGNLYTYDSAPNSLFTYNALQNKTLTFDNFRDGYLYQLGASYVFAETPDGHTQSIFPVGTAILTAPLYVAQYFLSHGEPAFANITLPAFEPQRLQDEKRVATIVVALASALFFLLALAFAPLASALVATVAFAFGSDMWTVGSQALWQHGSVALVTIAMCLALLASVRNPSARFAVFAAGVCAGFLWVVRPTAAAYSLAGLLFTVQNIRSRTWLFGLGLVIGALPGIAWNVTQFHNIIGGYGRIEGSYIFTFDQFVTAINGLLVSPNRGLIVFSPFVMFTILGAARIWRSRDPRVRLLQLLALASLAILASYGFFERWEGGATFGPRYLTDLMPTAALLLLVMLPNNVTAGVKAARVAVWAVLVSVFLSVCVQVVGANGEPKSNWSGIPTDASLDTARIWNWSDSQIQRDALSCWRLWTANPTFDPSYDAGFNGRIAAISFGKTSDPERIAVDPSEKIAVSALLENSGTSPWYGYTTGMYYGQTRVRVRFLDSLQRVALERYIYVAGTIERGQRSSVSETLDVPSQPGRYIAVFDIDVFQDPVLGARHVGSRSVDVLVS